MKKITVIGGDERSRVAMEALKEKGYAVDQIGLFEEADGDTETSQVLLLPVPTTKDGTTVHCPLTRRKILLQTVAGIAGDRLVLCGNYRLGVPNETDYCKTDAYAIRNAVPTAEGAIAIAIREMPTTLWNSRVLVVGYGRVGQVLCDRLIGMRCDVTVSVRKPADFARLEALRIPAVKTAEIARYADRFDIVFNTVDAPVLEESLPLLTKALLIDLSSKGGYCTEHADGFGIRHLTAPGLPGKIAPRTAGLILADTVHELIMQKSNEKENLL